MPDSKKASHRCTVRGLYRFSNGPLITCDEIYGLNGSFEAFTTVPLMVHVP